jgi:transcription elongation factor GreA
MLEQIKQKIENEIQRLHHELSVTLPVAIRRAAELGDLRENADYKSAIERQQFVQARIGHLTQRLSELSKIDVSAIPDDRVSFGSRVKLKDRRTGGEVEYTITAGDYIDLDAGHISMASPIARALLGRQVGEEVAVQLPVGRKDYEILELTTLPEMLNS